MVASLFGIRNVGAAHSLWLTHLRHLIYKGGLVQPLALPHEFLGPGMVCYDKA